LKPWFLDLVTAIRSLLFMLYAILFSLGTFVLALVTLILPRPVLVAMSRFWAHGILFGLKWICGLSYEIRGPAEKAQGPVIVAAKHYTMWETIAFMALLKDPAIVLKRDLMNIPLYGWYAKKMRMIPVDRAGHASALRAMRDAASRALQDGRPIVIFPEGTRRKIGAPPAYKRGVAGLYTHTGAPCVPAALNSGLYWVGNGFLKRPGTIVVEYLETIPPGLDRDTFMDLMQTRIETASAKLIREGDT